MVATASVGSTTGAHHVSIRPERLLLAPAGAGLAARVERLIYLGTDLQLLARLTDGTPVTVRLQNSSRTEMPAPGAEIFLQVEAGAVRLLVN
jgi:spermidine/putrescine transport system ATP-binding protein